MPIEIRVESTFQAPLEVAFAYTALDLQRPRREPLDRCRRRSYELPGGIAGKALGKVIEPFVKIAVKHSSAALQKCVEAQVSR